ncbi:MAG: AGE family epimerase/isomerase [Puniceicoccaceae bacterium]
MNRRTFIGRTLAAGLGGALLGRTWAFGDAGEGPLRFSQSTLAEFYNACQRQLLKEYFPFWENGGHDGELGGFICYLYPDGSVQDPRKDIWYQGRGIWVYSHYYNAFAQSPDRHWLLTRARMAREFMVRYMHRGDGTWLTTVDRGGNPTGSIAVDRSQNIYGALFAAAGLIALAKAMGREEDLELARLALRKSIKRYEDPAYAGVTAPGVENSGLRSQGHTFMFLWVIPQLLELSPDPILEEVLSEHLELLHSKFWNPEFGISNEILEHDYARLPTQAGFMVPGHSIEAQWMGMLAARRLGKADMEANFRDRMRHLIEISWDEEFGGTCDTAYHAVATDGHPAGPVMDIKTMWAQTEVCIGTMLAYELSGETWARDWFNKSWFYLQETMTTPHGVWRQAVDRQGRDKQREGISPYRMGNFHQPRCLMYLMQSIRRQMGWGKG